MSTDAEVIEAVELAFSDLERPEHFTNHLHCEECAEHDQTLLQSDRDSLQVDAVTNPGWDPISFCSPHGKAYYLPSLVRFALNAVEGSGMPYWQHLQIHLEGDGPNSSLIEYCSTPRRLKNGAPWKKSSELMSIGQVRPSHSIERTSNGLRPSAASHVKR